MKLNAAATRFGNDMAPATPAASPEPTMPEATPAMSGPADKATFGASPKFGSVEGEVAKTAVETAKTAVEAAPQLIGQLNAIWGKLAALGLLATGAHSGMELANKFNHTNGLKEKAAQALAELSLVAKKLVPVTAEVEQTLVKTTKEAI